jgi:Spy/CpxP family protein refolding chaperone
MKKTIAKILLTSAFAATLALAQGPHNAPDPATFAQHRVERLTTLLSLTSAQQQQATTIFTNAATARSAAHANLKTAHQNLKDAVKSNNTATIDQAANAIGALTTQTTSIYAKAQAAFFQILTPDQQTKLSQFESQNHGHGRRGHQ